MKRREFLKTLLGATVLASIPTAVLTAFELGHTDVITYNGLIIDWNTKTIKVIPTEENKNGINIYDIYATLANLWKESAYNKLDFPFVKYRITISPDVL